MTENKVINIYEWRRPLKPGELPRGCVLTVMDMPIEPERNERPRKIRLSEIGLAIGLVTLLSLLIASYV
jgi:hypothetical protein